MLTRQIERKDSIGQSWFPVGGTKKYWGTWERSRWDYVVDVVAASVAFGVSAAEAELS